MSKEPSTVGKVVAVIDDLLELWRQRRKLVCGIVIAIILAPPGLVLYQG